MLFFPNSKQYNLKSPVNNCSRLRWVEGFMCGVKGLSTTNVDDYGMLTTHNQMPHFLSHSTELRVIKIFYSFHLKI